MPLPKPRDSETRNEFIDRCMGDDVANSEFPSNDARYAVCVSLYENKEDKSCEAIAYLKGIQKVLNG